MIRIHLSPEQRQSLHTLRRDPTLTPAERDRVEMLFLSADGWAPAVIARHLGYCVDTVRRVLKRIDLNDLTGLRRQRPGPPPALERRQTFETALAELLAEDRTWTASQLAAALGERGLALAPRTVRRYLRRMQAGYRRTVRTLRHKQDPIRVEAAEKELAALKETPKPVTLHSLTWTSADSAPASRSMPAGRSAVNGNASPTRTRRGAA